MNRISKSSFKTSNISFFSFDTFCIYKESVELYTHTAQKRTSSSFLPNSLLAGRAGETAAKLRRKSITLCIVPDGHLSASHDFVHFVPIVEVLLLQEHRPGNPCALLGGGDKLCLSSCGSSVAIHKKHTNPSFNALFLYQIMLEMPSFISRKTKKSDSSQFNGIIMR